MTSKPFRRLKFIIYPIIFFFVWTNLGIYNIVQAATTEQGQESGGKGQSKQKTAEEKFQEAIDKIRENTEKAEQKLTKGETAETEETEIKIQKAEVEKLDAEIKKQFKATEEKIKDLPEVIKQRHRDFVKKYEENLKELKTNLNDIEKAKTKEEKRQAHQKTKDFLEKTKPPSRHTPLDPNKLPHRTPDIKKREPRTKPEEFKEFESENSKQYAVGSKQQKLILVASNGPLTGLVSDLPTFESVALPFMGNSSSLGINPNAFLSPSPLAGEGRGEGNLLLAQATIDLPTPADLSETIEVQFTDDIKAKAAELNNSPVKIYEWVRNNIEYVPTYGSIQGADMCLQTKQCNDFDTISLLIALLRTSNISARYVYGTIELPIDKVMNWVGGFTDENSAVNFIVSGGIPIKAYTYGGKIAKVQMEHVWVEGYVPYGPYSGRPSKLNPPKTWIPLDPSYKQYNYTNGIDIQTAVPFDAQSFLNQIKSTATINETEGYVTNVDSSYIQTTLTDYQTQLQNYISQNMPNATVGDILGKKEIKKQELGILPATLPYERIATGTKYTELPDNLRHKITFEIQDPYFFETSLSYTASLPELAGKRITLSYAPAATTDEQTINSYGGIYNVPAYLVNMKPQIKVEGVVKATGGSIGLGNQQGFDMRFTSPSYGTDIVSNQVFAGAYYGIGLNPYKISKGLVEKRKMKLEAVQGTVSSSNIYTDDYIGELLYTTAAVYFFELDAFESIYASSYKIANVKQVSEGMVAKDISVSYSFGIPIKALEGGLTIDVDRYIHSPVSISGDATKTQQFMLSLGQMSSGMEHGIFEQLYNKTGTSAVKVLSVANSQGIQIYTVNASNIANVLPVLQISEQVKTDIQNAVNAGKTVTVSKTNVTVDTWNGVGYVILDPNTGAGAYMISGGFAGGGADVKIPWIVEKYFELIHILDELAVIGSVIFVISALTIYLIQEIGILAFATALGTALLGIILGAIIALVVIYIVYLLIASLTTALNKIQKRYVFRKELSWQTSILQFT